VHICRKLSAVLGTTLAKSSILTRPISFPPIERSKKTIGFFFDVLAFGADEGVVPSACELMMTKMKTEKAIANRTEIQIPKFVIISFFFFFLLLQTGSLFLYLAEDSVWRSLPTVEHIMAGNVCFR
jgi:hypothetical protein